MAWKDTWELKGEESSKVSPLNKVSIFAIAKEIDRINTSDHMQVVATMMEPLVDVKIKDSKDADKSYQAYDALVFYKLRIIKETKPIAPTKPSIFVPTVDLE